MAAKDSQQLIIFDLYSSGIELPYVESKIHTSVGTFVRRKLDVIALAKLFFPKSAEVDLMSIDGKWKKKLKNRTITLKVMNLWVSTFYSTFGLKPKWEPFEELWGVRNLRTQYFRKESDSIFWENLLSPVFNPKN